MKRKKLLRNISERAFWVAVIPAGLLVIQSAASIVGYDVDLNGISKELMDLVNSLFAVLYILDYDWRKRKGKKKEGNRT